MPERIQRRMTANWRAPLDAEGRRPVYVGRPGKYGNPYRVESVNRHGMHPFGFRVNPEPSVAARGYVYHTEAEAVARAVALYRRMVEAWSPEKTAEVREALAGRNLMCWCAEGAECHADVLLELANGGDGRG